MCSVPPSENIQPDEGVMSDVLQHLKSNGYSNSFKFANGRMRCLESDAIFESNQLSVEVIYRFEGSSDPQDEAAIYALKAADGTSGVFVDAYGPESDSEAAAFLCSMPDHREKSNITPDMPSAKVIKIRVAPETKKEAGHMLTKT